MNVMDFAPKKYTYGHVTSSMQEHFKWHVKFFVCFIALFMFSLICFVLLLLLKSFKVYRICLIIQFQQLENLIFSKKVKEIYAICDQRLRW